MSVSLDELAQAVAWMRTQQRAFFAAKPGSVMRQNALVASKAAEKKVDELVARIAGRAPAQESLFGERK